MVIPLGAESSQSQEQVKWGKRASARITGQQEGPWSLVPLWSLVVLAGCPVLGQDLLQPELVGTVGLGAKKEPWRNPLLQGVF